jgi:hypothetical protein
MGTSKQNLGDKDLINQGAEDRIIWYINTDNTNRITPYKGRNQFKVTKNDSNATIQQDSVGVNIG